MKFDKMKLQKNENKNKLNYKITNYLFSGDTFIKYINLTSVYFIFIYR